MGSSLKNQVLILNFTRMGDLVQTIPLVSRLHQEWPEVAVDLVVDKRCASIAGLIPGLRHVLASDFEERFTQGPAMTKDEASLHHEVDVWARPLRAAKYDRVINLTFTRVSGLLAASLGVPDTRGVITTPHGSSIVRNAWLTYFVDLLHYRRFNRFNLVDLYALGGSGPGPHVPIRLPVPSQAEEWARRYLSLTMKDHRPVAVQVGASKSIKAWRPEYFGRSMAAINRRFDTGFVLTGTQGDAACAQQAISVYRASGGSGPLCDATGRTDVPQLAALLARCGLLLSNDTGPMHIAVGVGTPVVDLSVGHVDFCESGPYGPGQWVIQPDLPCSPCGFDQVCPHHACKDQIIPEQVAALSLHVLGLAPVPSSWSGSRLYESRLDEDGLVDYRLRAGPRDDASDWYRTFWRRYWYETLTGRLSCVPDDAAPPPDLAEQQSLFRGLEPIFDRLIRHADEVASFSRPQPVLRSRLEAAQAALNDERQRMISLVMPSAAFSPVTVALMRDLHNNDVVGDCAIAEQQAKAYRAWGMRARAVMERLAGVRGTATSVRQASESAMSDGSSHDGESPRVCAAMDAER